MITLTFRLLNESQSNRVFVVPCFSIVLMLVILYVCTYYVLIALCKNPLIGFRAENAEKLKNVLYYFV